MEDASKKGFEYYLDEVKYLEEYSKRFCCGCCGARLSSSICSYCKEKIEDEEKLNEIEKINERLSIIVASLPEEINCNETLNFLYLMRSFNVVDEYLKKINYRSLLEKEKLLLDSKLNNSEKISKKEVEKYEFIAKHLLSDSKEKEQYALAAIRKVLLNLAEFSPLYIEKVFIELINLVLKNTKMSDVNISISELDEDVLGLAKTETLQLTNKTFERKTLIISRNEIRKFFQGDFSVLMTIFHEARHFYQPITYKESNKPNIFNYFGLKDRLLTNFSQDYYNLNYSNLLFELDAELIAINETLNFFPLVKLALSDEGISWYTEQQKQIIEKSTNLERTFENKKGNLNEIFSAFIIDKPELLENYPYLQYQYIAENGLVRELTKEEVLKKYKSFDNSQLNDEEKTNAYQFFNYVYITAKEESLNHEKEEIANKKV